MFGRMDEIVEKGKEIISEQRIRNERKKKHL